MRKPPLADKVKRPFQYTPAIETNIAVSIRRARAAIEATRSHYNNVRPIVKKKAAA